MKMFILAFLLIGCSIKLDGPTKAIEELDKEINSLKISACDLQNTVTMVHLLKILDIKGIDQIKMDEFSKWSLTYCSRIYEK